MSISKLDRFLKTCVTSGDIAGIVCWVGDLREERFCNAYGFRQVTPSRLPITTHTLFDTASLTKPIATALAFMTLQEAGMITMQDTVVGYLGRIRDATGTGTTLMQLLTHTSGLPAWYPVYTLPRHDRLAFLTDRRTATHVVYSCLGYILLGVILEKITGCPLDTYCRDRLYAPLGLPDTLFTPSARENIAATELGNEHEKEMASRHADISGVPWRTHLLCGEVHDGNAYYAYDGVAGNAGLFSTALDLATLMRAYLRGEIVSPESVSYMTTDHTGGDEKRGVGWVIDAFPEYLSHNTFSHTGFTGTMLACDPDRSLIIVLLTNAVHPHVRRDLMAPVRKRVIQLIAEEIG
jgi:CubicO group peptidase (beta-lactamase class C family)